MTNDPIKYSWNQVDIHLITNYYLYGNGKPNTPEDYAERLRGEKNQITIAIDTNGLPQLLLSQQQMSQIC